MVDTPNPQRLVSSSRTRREFLATTSVAAFSAGVWSEIPVKASTSSIEKLKILCVGTANRASADIKGIESEEIIGLCDIDKNYLDHAAATFSGAKTYRDYRQMIDVEAKNADAIMVATADHNHFPASMLAIKAGLHCYCEKPLTHTVDEARKIALVAKEKSVATQMGTQIHAGQNYRRVVEVIKADVIGDVKEVHVWVGKSWGGGKRSKESQQPPATLDWDLWLGPAPERPYAAGAYHPAQWRRWWDFGQGTLGDMGCHYMDLPFWALGLRHPTRISAEGPAVNSETCPRGLVVHYDFPARGEQPPVSMTWYDGNKIPSKVAGISVPGSGVMFVGTEGSLFSTYHSFKLFPKEKYANFQPPPKAIPDSIGHHAEWIKACKEGTPTTCNFDYSGALTETVLLGNVAFRTGKAIQWDADTMMPKDCPEAEQYIRKEYRNGWEV